MDTSTRQQGFEIRVFPLLVELPMAVEPHLPVCELYRWQLCPNMTLLCRGANLGFQDVAFLPSELIFHHISNIVVEVMTLGLSQVCKLWPQVSKGMLPVKHLAPKILKIMAVNNCGCQLTRRLVWAVTDYTKRNVQPCILECASLACSMTRGPMSVLG